MSSVEKAVYRFKEGSLCSQSVFSTHAEKLGLDLETAMKIATPFGGGIFAPSDKKNRPLSYYLILSIRVLLKSFLATIYTIWFYLKEYILRLVYALTNPCLINRGILTKEKFYVFIYIDWSI